MTTPTTAREPRTIVLAGASGLIGTPVVRHLRRRGDRVRLLVRRPVADPDEVRWDPSRGELDVRALEGASAVVNLGGRNVGDRRWTRAFKEEIRRSRIDGTELVARTLARCDEPPRRLVQASASGYYGNRGEETLDESSAPGTGFLPDLVQEWEAATRPAADAGIQVVHLRSGLVLAPRGGAGGRLLPLFRLGLGGRLGSGDQWWPWITLADEVRAILHLLDSSRTGPVNLCAPYPARNSAVTRALAQAMHRPAVLPVPAFALRLALGEFAGEILGSKRIVPAALPGDGFTFQHTSITDAAQWLTR